MPSIGVSPRDAVMGTVMSGPGGDAGGDGDVGAGPPFPLGYDLKAATPRYNTDKPNSQEALKARIRNLEASGDEHEKLRDRIRSLEESLQKLERESLERAKLGMEQLAEKYFPKMPAATSTHIMTASAVTRPGV